MNNLSSSMNNSVEWRRNKVQELASQGYNQSEISRILQISQPTINSCHFDIVDTLNPVEGSKKSLSAKCLLLVKLNIFVSKPAFSSNDWLSIRPRFQLSSIKRIIDDWSVT